MDKIWRAHSRVVGLLYFPFLIETRGNFYFALNTFKQSSAPVLSKLGCMNLITTVDKPELSSSWGFPFSELYLLIPKMALGILVNQLAISETLLHLRWTVYPNGIHVGPGACVCVCVLRQQHEKPQRGGGGGGGVKPRRRSSKKETRSARTETEWVLIDGRWCLLSGH